MRSNLHTFLWVMAALAAIPFLSSALLLMTLINILKLTVDVPRIFIQAAKESEREFSDLWLSDLEPHQRRWLERKQKVSEYLQRVDRYLRQNTFQGVAAQAFEDITSYKS